jgi:hypothetical protein
LLSRQSPFADRREDDIAAVPLAIVAASIGAGIYMPFIWRLQGGPEQAKCYVATDGRIADFWSVINGSKTYQQLQTKWSRAKSREGSK